jgi:hypothetical protein
MEFYLFLLACKQAFFLFSFSFTVMWDRCRAKMYSSHFVSIAGVFLVCPCMTISIATTTPLTFGQCGILEFFTIDHWCEPCDGVFLLSTFDAHSQNHGLNSR